MYCQSEFRVLLVFLAFSLYCPQKSKLEVAQRLFLEHAPQIAQAIHGQDPEAAKLATRSLRDIVSILSVYRTPEVRPGC
jgi:hypothetical protein